jgi:hypothetical protein
LATQSKSGTEIVAGDDEEDEEEELEAVNGKRKLKV